MPAVSVRRRALPWFLQGLLAVAAAMGLRALIKHVVLAMLRMRHSLMGPRVQHVLLLKFPSLAEDSEDRRRFDEVLAKMNLLPGIRASFHRFGSLALGKEALLRELGRPDRSNRFTHCLLVVADDLLSLKRYLHGATQQQELSPLITKYYAGAYSVDVELGLDLVPKGKDDPLLQIVLLRFQAHVVKGSPIYQSFQEVIEELDKNTGIRASLRPLGYGSIDKEQVLKVITWPDRSQGVSHCLTVAADSLSDLKGLHATETYNKWLQMGLPHLCNDGEPAAVIFIAPMQLAAKIY